MNTKDDDDDDSSLCPVCKEPFTDSTKAPSCLKCGHVLCRQCAFIIVTNSNVSGRICPICRNPNTFHDVRTIYIGNVRLTNDGRKLQTENEDLRQILRSTKELFERKMQTLRWYEKQHSQKCNQHSKTLAYYRKSGDYLYRKMRYYRYNWYKLKDNFEKLKIQKNRLNSQLLYLKKNFRNKRTTVRFNGRQSYTVWE